MFTKFLNFSLYQSNKQEKKEFKKYFFIHELLIKLCATRNRKTILFYEILFWKRIDNRTKFIQQGQNLGRLILTLFDKSLWSKSKLWFWLFLVSYFLSDFLLFGSGSWSEQNSVKWPPLSGGLFRKNVNLERSHFDTKNRLK